MIPHSQLLENSNLTCHTSDVSLRKKEKKVTGLVKTRSGVLSGSENKINLQ